jgi:hypothetical protein
MLDVGTQLARKAGDGPAAIQVVGMAGQRYVCQELPFGANQTYSAEELRLLYGAEDAEVIVVTEQESWAKLSTTAYTGAVNDARQAERDHAELPSPEAVFSAAAREATEQANIQFASKARRKA